MKTNCPPGKHVTEITVLSDIRCQVLIEHVFTRNIYNHPMEGLWELYRGERKAHKLKFCMKKFDVVGYSYVEKNGKSNKNSLPVGEVSHMYSSVHAVTKSFFIYLA